MRRVGAGHFSTKLREGGLRFYFDAYPCSGKRSAPEGFQMPGTRIACKPVCEYSQNILAGVGRSKYGFFSGKKMRMRQKAMPDHEAERYPEENMPE